MRTDDHDNDGMLEFRREVIAAFLNIFRNNDSSLANNGQMDHASPRQYCLKLSDVNWFSSAWRSTIFASNATVRVPFIWTKLSYQKKGFMRVVPLHKDSKNAFGLNIALKPRSHQVRKGLLSRFTKQNWATWQNSSKWPFLSSLMWIFCLIWHN